MDLSRIYRLHRMLASRRGRPASTQSLMAEMQCSRSTLHRTLTHLRDDLGAPVLNAPSRGYFYDRQAESFELPGIWFRPDELEALLVMDHFIEQLQPGLLHDQVKELRSKIRDLLSAGTRTARRFPADRVRILAAHARRVTNRQLTPVIGALIARRQLAFTYDGRATSKAEERRASPQRLVHYRDQWYADCYDENKHALRTFAVDRMANSRPLADAARDIPDAQLDAELTGGYGIFAGAPRHEAHLVFTAQRAQWVADEVWHPDQVGTFREDGSYELAIPYADPRELLGEILRYGPDVQVVAPSSLVALVRERLAKAAAQYG